MPLSACQHWRADQAANAAQGYAPTPRRGARSICLTLGTRFWLFGARPDCGKARSVPTRSWRMRSMSRRSGFACLRRPTPCRLRCLAFSWHSMISANSRARFRRKCRASGRNRCSVPGLGGSLGRAMMRSQRFFWSNLRGKVGLMAFYRLAGGGRDGLSINAPASFAPSRGIMAALSMCRTMPAPR